MMFCPSLCIISVYMLNSRLYLFLLLLIPFTKGIHSRQVMPSSPTARQGVDCIVVGSGLAGLTAAIICLDRGGKVLLLEREAKLGGNSIKASSGINACPADDDGIASKEEIDAFVQDTMKSAGKGANSQLIETLVTNSAIALKWLNDRIEVDLLQSRTRLGGHSRERTHRPVKGAVGFSVINGMQKALKLFQENGTLEIMTETALTGLLPSEDGKSVIGVTAQHGSDELCLKAPHVVLATGGFAADRTDDSYLAKHRPEYLHMPATFGDFSTGDGIKLTTAGAGTCLMEKVQVHPTGFIDPADPSSSSKFLCVELLRGMGAILFVSL
jgi:succinate dehydrogenase/fumarate reductase flavoprotein subunit